MSEWAAEDINTLQRLVAEGLSAGEISKKMDRSRNAVIGKIMRMKGGVGRLARSEGSVGKVVRKQSPLGARRVVRPAAQPPIALPVFERPQPYVPVANLPATLPITFLEAVDGKRCLHFVGDPYSADGPDMPVCGAERSAAAGIVPYCHRHFTSARREVLG